MSANVFGRADKVFQSSEDDEILVWSVFSNLACIGFHATWVQRDKL